MTNEANACAPGDLVTEQNSLLVAVQKAVSNFKKDPATRKTESYYRARLESLNSLRLEFRANHRQLMRLTSDKVVQKEYIESDTCDVFEEAFIAAVALIREGYNLAFPPVQATTPSKAVNETPTVVTPENSEVPLPTVKLPTFSGKYVEWPTFKEVFEARVHHNKQLTDYQRFHYLKGALSAEAAQDIEHLSFVGSNYQTAWSMLIKTYDNKRLLFFHYMNVFDQTPVVSRDDAASLKRFTQTCRSCVNSIKKLGVNIDEQNQIFVHYMLKKLPTSVRNEWEKSQRAETNIPIFSDLCEFLDQQHQMLITSKSSAGLLKQSSQEARRKGDVTRVYHLAAKGIECPICTKGNHPVRDCTVFLSFSVADRKIAVDKHKLCFNCLGHNHRSTKCSSRRSCFTCGKRHHTLIHDAQPEMTSMHVAAAADTGLQSTTLNVLLPTAIVSIENADGLPLPFRAFLDQGSQASFVTERAVQLLRVPRHKTLINITGLSDVKVADSRSYVILTVGSRYDMDIKHQVLAYVLPKIGHTMPSKRITPESWPHLSGLPLADPRYFEPQGIDLLLGNNVYDEIICKDIRRGKRGEPIGQHTAFGYILSGKVDAQLSSSPALSSLHVHIDNELEQLLERFWELEECLEEHPSSQLDQWCEQFYQTTTTRMKTGKYIVRLPFLSKLDSSKVIGTSKHVALKRLIHLEHRLAQNPSLKDIYQSTIDEYLQLGQMQCVDTTEQYHREFKGNILTYTCCYLPHHPVFKESSSTTKVRVVFDASAKTSNGKSLNDILATGPALQTDLSSILTNWRFFKYVFLADVEKMYRCINMNEEDAQYQRILWRRNPNEEVAEYFCSTVMFGTRPAPFLAIRTLHQLADDEAKKFPLAVDVIKHQMYVDDILSGGNTIEEALEVQTQTIGMLNRGSFSPRKWSSNHNKLLEPIPIVQRETKEPLRLNATETLKTLGMYWNPASDEFTYGIKFDLPSGSPTKRIILSTIARLFDPLGWLNPIIIKAKLMMQQLWILKIGWDETVPKAVQTSWEQYIKELPSIERIRIPRWLNAHNARSHNTIHIFCDASANAYSAVAYLRCKNENGRYHTTLLLAKCKVASIKPKLTIPRAELCAATLAIKLFKFLKLNLHTNLDFSETVFWSDSMVVLGWIRSDSTRWKVFVANRLSKILEVSGAHQWRHVASTDNPADCSSRGINPAKIAQHPLWWTGPSWLQQHHKYWPDATINPNLSLAGVEEEMTKTSIKVHLINTERQHLSTFINGVSSYTHLIRVIAHCHRFSFNCRHPQGKRNGGLMIEELNRSLTDIISIVQREAFTPEWKALSSNRNISETSTLSPLFPSLIIPSVLYD